MRAVRSQPIAPCATDDAHGWDKCVPGRYSHVWHGSSRQQHLKSAADGVSRCELQPSTLRCIRCRAATAPGAAQHRLNNTAVRVCMTRRFDVNSVALGLHTRASLWSSTAEGSRASATHEMTCSSRRLRLYKQGQLGRPLGNGQLGRGTLTGAALHGCVHGLCAGVVLWCRGCSE